MSVTHRVLTRVERNGFEPTRVRTEDAGLNLNFSIVLKAEFPFATNTSPVILSSAIADGPFTSDGLDNAVTNPEITFVVSLILNAVIKLLVEVTLP